ncbi:ketopantoate reductase family protein [Rathayibacter festucae]|uniref:ketopantoate reductase family protein n=1 Tax=Rathayibacter festucae TaxID=110937 RepID=UPI002A6A32D2|nr:2-dehydropantoate 2-reductase N-terminal domain-containing protein [Rathayibacter festucae]MDY0911943.1 2-dehydropantoate 2-reductase N-terminal domain-containing protein [Rathayibacter festucae]
MSGRFLVIGGGAVGSVLAAQLHLAGLPVVLVARGEHLRLLRENGLRVRRPAGDEIVRLPVAGGPAEAAPARGDVLVLAVKAQDAEAALAEWAWTPLAGGGAGAELPMLTLQNGLATEDSALRRFAAVYGVSIGIAASFLVPGEVVSPSFPTVGVLWIGRHPDAADPRAEEFAAILRGAGFAARAVPDIGAWKARKLLANAANGLDLFEGPADQRAAAREQLVAEARAALAANGLAVASDDGTRLAVDPVPGHTAGRLSTWQSAARGTSSEIDHLTGEIVLLARRAGVPAPANERLQLLLGLHGSAAAAEPLPLADLLDPAAPALTSVE